MRSVAITFRPLDAWPWSVTRPRLGSARFKAKWLDTVDLLDRELFNLGAREVVLQVDLPASRITRQGLPYADSTPETPRVVLHLKSRHGSLTYPCDTYDTWQANVRGIALSLEALRAVDRHGVTKRGEQYSGFRALPASTTATLTVEQSAARVVTFGGGEAGAILRDRATAQAALRRAMANTHPDKGGDAAAFSAIQEAKRVLEAHHGGAL